MHPPHSQNDASELPVRPAVESSGVAALAWDKAGRRLAFGCEDGRSGILALPRRAWMTGLGAYLRTAFGIPKADPEAIRRVKTWAGAALAAPEHGLRRQRDRLQRSRLPEVETIILVMEPGRRTRACKVLKALDDVTEQDVREALRGKEVVLVPHRAYRRLRPRPARGDDSLPGPQYAQRYRQRLGGRDRQLRRIVERFDADARANGETIASAVARLRGNSDDIASRQGTAMQGNMERLARMEAHRQAMIEAGPFRRVGLMLRDGDADVMQAAYRDFEPALPVTEGILAARWAS